MSINRQLFPSLLTSTSKNSQFRVSTSWKKPWKKPKPKNPCWFKEPQCWSAMEAMTSWPLCLWQTRGVEVPNLSEQATAWIFRPLVKQTKPDWDLVGSTATWHDNTWIIHDNTWYMVLSVLILWNTSESGIIFENRTTWELSTRNRR